MTFSRALDASNKVVFSEGWNRQVRNYPNHFWVLQPTCKMFFKIIQQSTSRYVKINQVWASLCFLKWRPFSSQTWEWVTDFTIYFDSDVLGLKVFSSSHLKRCHPKGYTRTVGWVLFLLRAAGDITWVKCMGNTLETSHRSRFGEWKFKDLRLQLRLRSENP